MPSPHRLDFAIIHKLSGINAALIETVQYRSDSVDRARLTQKHRNFSNALFPHSFLPALVSVQILFCSSNSFPKVQQTSTASSLPLPTNLPPPYLHTQPTG
ncbi:hypothetical protein WAI453_012381 [Rhynchosporium graminicola]